MYIESQFMFLKYSVHQMFFSNYILYEKVSLKILIYSMDLHSG